MIGYWMKTFISLLRGINVGGQKIIRMEELRSLYEDLKLSNIQTYVQSGNVIFDSNDSNASKITELIETQIINILGYSVSVFIRNSNDFHRIINSNPFTERKEDPAKLHVTFLYRTPSQSSLDVPDTGLDECILQGEEILLFCPNGYGRTKLTNSFFEKKLNIPCTTRNWKTVNALYRIANER